MTAVSSTHFTSHDLIGNRLTCYNLLEESRESNELIRKCLDPRAFKTLKFPTTEVQRDAIAEYLLRNKETPDVTQLLKKIQRVPYDDVAVHAARCLKLVHFLLEIGVPLEQEGLYFVALAGNLSLLQRLLDEPYAARDKLTIKILNAAARGGHLTLIRWLLDENIIPVKPIDIQKAIERAKSKGQKETADYLQTHLSRLLPELDESTLNLLKPESNFWIRSALQQALSGQDPLNGKAYEDAHEEQVGLAKWIHQNQYSASVRKLSSHFKALSYSLDQLSEFSAAGLQLVNFLTAIGVAPQPYFGYLRALGGDFEGVKELTHLPRSAEHALIAAARTGRTEICKWAVEEMRVPIDNASKAIQYALQFGHSSTAKYLTFAFYS